MMTHESMRENQTIPRRGPARSPVSRRRTAGLETRPMTIPARNPRRSLRRGVTLIELMVVILIIGILTALLLPAVMGAVRRAYDATVLGEINQLSQALANFQEKYGDLPPSRIILWESGQYNTLDQTPLSSTSGQWLNHANPAVAPGLQPLMSATDITVGQLSQRSLQYLNRFFPKAQYLGPGIPGQYLSNGFWYDFNGNGRFDQQPILLEGHECLVFFLGGIPTVTADTGSQRVVFGMSGFSKQFQSPAFPNAPNPFVNSTVTANRDAPFYTNFRAERLADDDNDGMPGYTDSLSALADPYGIGNSRYYAYFRSYGGQSNYDPNDVNFRFDTDPTGQNVLHRVFQVQFTPVGSSANIVASYAPNPYTTSDPAPSLMGITSSPVVNYQAPETYQIISAGRDHLYGVGGLYSPAANERLPMPDASAQGLDPGMRISEHDNLTSFATSGVLE